MTNSNECKQNTDPLKLIREGTSQDQRFPPELEPAYARIDERQPEHAMVFARAYAKYLQFYGSNNTATGNWEPFFSQDVSVQLAIAAVQDVDTYKNNIKASFDFLKNNENKNKEPELKNHLGYLFSTIGTLAKQLDSLKSGLPNEIALKSTLQNLIQNQLATAFGRLIAYYKADILILPDSGRLIADVQPDIVILGESTAAFSNIYSYNFSKDWWITNNSADWSAYTATITADSSVYGSSVTVFERINHIATHNLFTSIFDQFLKVFARTVIEAKAALESTFTNCDNHEPHYALFLSFLKLFDHARAEANTLTQRHLDFYYREILKLQEKPAEPSHAHLLIELAKHVDSHEIKADEFFKAGKDDSGIEAFFANDQDFVANQAKVTGLKTLYRHKDDSLTNQKNRLFASPIANSADGLGAKLTTPDQSWHPFFNKTYNDGVTRINMPQTEVGFAIASHYLWLAEGERTITIDFKIKKSPNELIPLMVQPIFKTTTKHEFNQQDTVGYKNEIICLVTTEKGWFEKAAEKFIIESGVLRLEIKLSGADPAVTPYSLKAHGYNFSTNLPVLLVKLKHQDNHEYLYRSVQDMVIDTIGLTVAVRDRGLKSLAVSNDFGPVDTSKPFQPFGASPMANSALVIGSKEAFQKTLSTATVNISWQNTPSPYNDTVNINIKYLQNGVWQPSGINARNITYKTFPLSSNLDKPVVNVPDFSESELYNTSSRHGFVRFETSEDFGQSAYEQALIDYIKSVTDTIPNNEGKKPIPPVGPFVTELTLDYTTAIQAIALNNTDKLAFEKRQAHFFHLTPFGQYEQHRLLNSSQKEVYLVPQFNFERDNSKKDSNAEFYIGVTGLKPPQNLALLFQVADGTADPLSIKPDPHIHWSYLSGNEWVGFAKHEVQDGTDGLLNSGIITFAIPDDASSANTLLPTGQHWLRAAVADESDAVCRLLAVSAQGLTVTFKNQGNDPAYPAKSLPAGTISKLDQPDAAVKKVTQPFTSFGGRAAEQSSAFYTRISERLRHKDRAIALWDYERLILEAFPQIYKVKCLNYTEYEPSGVTGIYRELAPGHLTIITIPNQQFHNLRDPLRPYTSLGLLENIKAFLQKRLSCFVKLHVKNPLFEEVGAHFKVRFLEGFDETFYANKLDEAITRFLSPWAFPGGGNPTFGGKVYQSVLINFVEEQPYVDYVTDFKLSHTYTKPDSNGLEIKVVDLDVAEIEGSKAVSILVSAKHHIIYVINPSQEETPGETCPCAA